MGGRPPKNPRTTSTGSGGPPGTGGSGGGGVDNDPCPAQLRASVSGPAQGIVVGTWLDVVLDKTSTPSRVVLVDAVAGKVGALMGVPSLALLIRCLMDGVVYRAYVAAVSGGQIDVSITRQ